MARVTSCRGENYSNFCVVVDYQKLELQNLEAGDQTLTKSELQDISEKVDSLQIDVGEVKDNADDIQDDVTQLKIDLGDVQDSVNGISMKLKTYPSPFQY